MRSVSSALVALGVGMTVLVCSSAQADRVLWLDYTGPSYVGMVGGNAKIVLQNQSGGCSSHALSPGGGLNERTVINGTNGGDSMYAVSWTVSFCNLTIEPIVANGNTLVLDGGQGDDLIFGWGLPNIHLKGNAGSDRVIGYGVPSVDGGFGADFLYGGNGTSLYGDPFGVIGAYGPDTLCVVAGEMVSYGYGGKGPGDVLCGPAASYTGIESFGGCNCSLF